MCQKTLIFLQNTDSVFINPPCFSLKFSCRHLPLQQNIQREKNSTKTEQHFITIRSYSQLMWKECKLRKISFQLIPLILSSLFSLLLLARTAIKMLSNRDAKEPAQNKAKWQLALCFVRCVYFIFRKLFLFCFSCYAHVTSARTL